MVSANEENVKVHVFLLSDDMIVYKKIVVWLK